ncbi:hypothetical protein EDB84DRAFT_1438203 [Lactarius hengduanensis]|nr:hypothetical protein EDB84DRAFT_1438203 [Lactarius hengduanensis]
MCDASLSSEDRGGAEAVHQIILSVLLHYETYCALCNPLRSAGSECQGFPYPPGFGQGLRVRVSTTFSPHLTARYKPMVPPPPFGCAQEPPSSSAATRLYDCDTEPHAMAVTVCRTLRHRRRAARYDSNGALHATTVMRRRTLRHRRRAARYDSIRVPYSTTPTAPRTLRQQGRTAHYDTDGAPHATTATASRTLRHRRRAACYDSDAASHATTPGFTRVRVEKIYPGVTRANHYRRGRTTKTYVIQ